MEKLFLEKPTLERKDEALNYIKEHIDNNAKFNGTNGMEECSKGLSYEEWLNNINKEEDPEYAKSIDRVPATTYFTIRESDNKIIGMVNIRHSLNDFLRKIGGHIGYGIRPSEQRKGYGKYQLFLALEESERLGIEDVLVACKVDNIPSDKTIKALGGVFEKNEMHNDEKFNLYWINVKESINKYQDIYENNNKTLEK